MRTVYKYRVPLNDSVVVVTAGRVTAVGTGHPIPDDFAGT